MNDHFTEAWYVTEYGELDPLDFNEPSGVSMGAVASPMQVKWLDSRKNWPDHFEQKLKSFMTTKKFYNYKSTQTRHIELLDEIVSDLAALFDQREWIQEKHAPKLKQKVLHKIHRLRDKAPQNPVDRIRDLLSGLSSEVSVNIYEEIVRVVIHKAGTIPVYNALKAAHLAG